jgi:hypothetical protein
MAVIEIARIQVRRGQELQTGIPQLESGELGWAEDTENLYIGKRVAGGAVDNSNTRILTENDLNLFKLAASNTGTLSSGYRYRAGTEYIDSVQSTVQKKLDSLNPNITDFGEIELGASGTNITDVFRHAIEQVFKNPSNPIDARRQLIIPPGVYTVSDIIELPPYTSITGSGPDLTTIIFDSSTTNLFQTVDLDGNNFESGNMQSGYAASQYVTISDMSLKFSNSFTTTKSLISLDNVRNAIVKNVQMITMFDPDMTTSYGLVSQGDHRVGIQLRGSGDLGGNENLCQNIHISDCLFDGLYRGVEGTGTVVRATINDSLFNNLTQGVALYTIDQTQGPNSCVIKNNKFQNILQQGIYVGENPNNNAIATNHISSENYFSRVGNGTSFNDLTTTQGTAVISFMGLQNKSVNDTFYRRLLGNTTTSQTFYYNPLIDGNISIDDTSVYITEVFEGQKTTVNKIPLIGKEQLVSIKYLMNNETLSRKGNLLINISATGKPDVVDNHNFSEEPFLWTASVPPVLAQCGRNVFAVDKTVYTEFVTEDVGNGNWLLQGSRIYQGQATRIVGTANGTGNALLVYTDPDDGFNFAPYHAVITQASNAGFTRIYLNSLSGITLTDTVTWPGDDGQFTYRVNGLHANNGNPYVTIDRQATTPIYQGDTLTFNVGAATENFDLKLNYSYPINFSVSDQHAASRNYVMLECTNTNPMIGFTLKYQINILG